MSATQYRRNRLEVTAYANSRAKAYRRNLRADLAEGLRDYQKNGVR